MRRAACGVRAEWPATPVAALASRARRFASTAAARPRLSLCAESRGGVRRLGELRHHLGRHQLERCQDLAAVMDALRDQEDHLILVGDDLLHLLQAAPNRVGGAENQPRPPWAKGCPPPLPDPHHALAPFLRLRVRRRADEDAAPAGLLAVLHGAAVPGCLLGVAAAKLVVEFQIVGEHDRLSALTCPET